MMETRENLIARVNNDFVYHAPKPDQIERYGKIRDKAKETALLLVQSCPLSRELSVALTKLDEVVMSRYE